MPDQYHAMEMIRLPFDVEEQRAPRRASVSAEIREELPGGGKKVMDDNAGIMRQLHDALRSGEHSIEEIEASRGKQDGGLGGRKNSASSKASTTRTVVSLVSLEKLMKAQVEKINQQYLKFTFFKFRFRC